MNRLGKHCTGQGRDEDLHGTYNTTWKRGWKARTIVGSRYLAIYEVNEENEEENEENEEDEEGNEENEEVCFINIFLASSIFECASSRCDIKRLKI